MPGIISTEYHAGQEIQAGDWTLVPFAKTFSIRAPGNFWGLTWNRPSSVLARHADGQEQVLPIPDYTRRVVWSLAGACLGTALLLWVIAILGREKR